MEVDIRPGEALRDLVRARQRLGKLLLRHDIVYDETASTWTAHHRAWLGRIDLGSGAQLTLLDYLGAVDALVIRRRVLENSSSLRACRDPVFVIAPWRRRGPLESSQGTSPR